MYRQHSIGRQFVAGLIGALGCLLAQAQSPATTLASSNPEIQTPTTPAAIARLHGRDLFAVTTPMGTLTPTQRATAIEQRLLGLAEGPATTLATLRVADDNGYSGIFADTVLIRAVTDADATHTGRTRQQLAADDLLIIRRALAAEYRDRGTAQILRGLLFSAVATVLLVIFLFGIRLLYRWIRARITHATQSWHWTGGLSRLPLLSPTTVANAGRSAIGTIAGLLGILLVYAYLEYVLSLFLWTRGIADQMVAAAEHAVIRVFTGLFDYLPSLLNVVVIVIVSRYILKALKAVFGHIATGQITISGFYPEWGQPTYSLVRFFVIAIAGIMVFPYLPGSGSEGFKGISVFVGLLVSFGAASSVANIMAGVIITYMRPFQLGDRVKIADAIGDVSAKNLLVVRLRTIKNVDITLPNALVLANHIINFSANSTQQGLILHTSVTIGYAAPWKTVHELLIKAAKQVDGVLGEPAPFVLQTSLDDFYVTYEINAYTKQPREMALIYSKLHEAIQNTFFEGGVEILSPHYAAVRDGNRMAVPDDYLPKDYRAPTFGILSRVTRGNQGR